MTNLGSTLIEEKVVEVDKNLDFDDLIAIAQECQIELNPEKIIGHFVLKYFNEIDDGRNKKSWWNFW